MLGHYSKMRFSPTLLQQCPCARNSDLINHSESRTLWGKNRIINDETNESKCCAMDTYIKLDFRSKYNHARHQMTI